MKLKNLSLIAGAIALTITATPHFTRAQDTGNGGNGGNGVHHHWKNKLTPAQIAQIKSYRTTAESQIQQILTQSQQDQLTEWQQKWQAKRQQWQQKHQQNNSASTQTPGANGHKHHRHGHIHSLYEKYARLNLTSDQWGQIGPIIYQEELQVRQYLQSLHSSSGSNQS